MKKKLTNDEVNALLERLVDEGHLIHHGGHPDQDFPLSFSRMRKPSGKPYPVLQYTEQPDGSFINRDKVVA